MKVEPLTLPELQAHPWERVDWGNHPRPFWVMGLVEDWVVMRRANCAPVLAHVLEFGKHKKYRPKGE